MRYQTLFLTLILIALSSCIKNRNKKFQKYSKEEVRKAVILSIATKLEKKYHVDRQEHLDKYDSPDQQDNIEDHKVDFLQRLRENQQQKSIYESP